MNTGYICVDLGGTNTRIARATDINDPASISEPIRHRNTHHYKNDLAFIVDSAKHLSNGDPITAIGIGVPGRVNDEKTGMLGSNNLPEWVNKGFAKELSQALQCPIYLDNDGVAAGLAEGLFGNAPNNFHYLIWGTGISGVEVTKKPDGSLQASYIRPRYHSFFQAWEKDCGGAAILHKHKKPGEQLLDEEWRQINSAFADHLHEYIVLTSPPALVFGGGLSLRHADTILQNKDSIKIPLSITEFGEDSGLVGGLALLRHNIT